jgi:hypothetical protein
MSIEPISGSVQQSPSSAPPANVPAPVKGAGEEQMALPPMRDKVELTPDALAKSLKEQGQTPSEIALRMGLDVQTIERYLGITPAVAPKAAAVPAAEAQPDKQAAAYNQAADKTAQPTERKPVQETTAPYAQQATQSAQGKK